MESQVSSNKNHYIYGLVDPDSNTIRYVGRSMNPFRRYGDHLRLAHDPQGEKRSWFESLAAEGKEPRMMKLDEVPTMEDAIRVEGDWISALTLVGLPLVNEAAPARRPRNRKPVLVKLETVWNGRDELPTYEATWQELNGETRTEEVTRTHYWTLMERNAHRPADRQEGRVLFH